MLTITFWGTRGSIPVAGPDYFHHGGATTCLEIGSDRVTDQAPERIIIDAGSGLATLGRQLASVAVEALVLQTHFHWDHIQGFPFFGPLYRAGSRLELWASAHDGVGFEEVLDAQMQHPTFPVGLDMLPAELCFERLGRAGRAARGGLEIAWTELDHPSANTAYRIDDGQCALVFSGDVEVQQGCRDRLVDFARGADVLVMDAQYTAEEYAERVGFGHSTAEDAVSVARDAGVGRLFLTHHDPGHDDRALAEKVAHARRLAGAALRVDNARDGLEVTIGQDRRAQSAPVV